MNIRIRLDHVIATLIVCREKVNEHRDLDFDLNHLLPVVEAAIAALEEEIHHELKQDN